MRADFPAESGRGGTQNVIARTPRPTSSPLVRAGDGNGGAHARRFGPATGCFTCLGNQGASGAGGGCNARTSLSANLTSRPRRSRPKRPNRPHRLDPNGDPLHFLGEVRHGACGARVHIDLHTEAGLPRTNSNPSQPWRVPQPLGQNRFGLSRLLERGHPLYYYPENIAVTPSD